jgi:glycosyltransferase involved in cell wall biosynthesis
MRIAILCPSFGEYGGIGRIAQALGREFVAAERNLALVCRSASGAAAPWDAAPRLEIPIHQLPRRWRHASRTARLGMTLLRVAPRLRGFLRDSHADVLLVLGISTYAPLALLASRWCPVVVSLQGGEPNGRFAAHPRVFRHLLRRASGIAACAASLANEAERLAAGVTAKMTVIPNGVDVSLFAAGPTYEHERPYVLAAGRFTRQKGFDVLLEAAARLEAVRRGDLHVLIAGDGMEGGRLARQVRALGLHEAIHFLGPVESPRLASLYRGARIVAIPSRWEGLPLVCLEAMATARPVVASRVDGIPDAVVDGETGLLVPSDDAAALAHALETLLADPTRSDRLGASGMARVRAEFSWPIVAERYLALLDRAAAHGRTSP